MDRGRKISQKNKSSKQREKMFQNTIMVVFEKSQNDFLPLLFSENVNCFSVLKTNRNLIHWTK